MVVPRSGHRLRRQTTERELKKRSCHLIAALLFSCVYGFELLNVARVSFAEVKHGLRLLIIKLL